MIILNQTNRLPEFATPWHWYLSQVARLDQLEAAGRLDAWQAENLRSRARNVAVSYGGDW